MSPDDGVGTAQARAVGAVEALWAAALAAVDALRGLPGAEVRLGVELPEAVVAGLAERAGVEVQRTLWLSDKPHLLYAFRAVLCGVAVCGQGARAARLGDELEAETRRVETFSRTVCPNDARRELEGSP